MSDYSRHTTNKGHLLLNIKPPSGTSSPQTRGIEQVQTITEVRNVPYQGLQTGTHLSYQGQAYPQNNIQNANIQRAYYGQNYNQQYQPNSLQPQAPANVHVFTPKTQVQVQQAYLNSRTISNQNPEIQMPSTRNQANIGQRTYKEKPFSEAQYWQQRKKQIADKNQEYDRLGQADSDNSQKRGGKGDDTVCCFPGYWLLILLLAFVVASFFIILGKSFVTNSTNSNTNSTTTANSTNTLNNSSNTNFYVIPTPSPSSNTNSSTNISGGTTTNGNTPASSSVNTGTTSSTAFMIPNQSHKLRSTHIENQHSRKIHNVKLTKVIT